MKQAIPRIFVYVLVVGLLVSSAALPQRTFAAQCPTLTRTLALGSRGSDVVSLQQWLISQQFLASGLATGYFGVLTQSAVQQWQARMNIVNSGTPDSTGWGVVGPKTRTAILKACTSGTTSSVSGDVNPPQGSVSSSTVPIPQTVPAPVTKNSIPSATTLPTTPQWPSAPGASTVSGEMSPFITAAGPTAAAWLVGDTFGNYVYGADAQSILHGSGGVTGETTNANQPVACSAVASLSGLGVILIAGQSNSANSAQADANGNFYTTDGPIYDLNVADGNCYIAKEPLLGTDGAGQAFGLPLADDLIGAGIFKGVLLVPIGVSGTYIEQWAPSSNYLFPRFTTAISDLRNVGLQPSFILWHQGEANAGDFLHGDTPTGVAINITPDLALAGTLNWMQNFFQIVSSIRAAGATAPILPAVATLCGTPATSTVIELAQTSVLDPAWGIYPGPNTDALPYSLRRTDDECHFSYQGNIVHAQAWMTTLQTYLASHALPSAYLSSPSSPFVSVTANGQTELTINDGGTYTLAWNSSHVSSCTMSYTGSSPGSFTVTPNTSVSGGSGVVGSYTLTCTGTNGQQVSKTTTISSASSPTPTPSASLAVALTVNGQQSVSLAQNAAFTLVWNVSNATSCTGTEQVGGGTGQDLGISPNTSGSSAGAAPAGGVIYTLTCSGSNGQSITKTATISILPSCSISITPSTIPQGGSATLTYSTQNGTRLDIAGFGSSGASFGSVAISPSVTSTYYGTVTGPGGTGQCSAELFVQ